MAGAIGERGAANAVAGLKLGVDQDGDVARSDLGEKLVQEIMRMKLVEPEAVIFPLSSPPEPPADFSPPQPLTSIAPMASTPAIAIIFFIFPVKNIFSPSKIKIDFLLPLS